MAGIAGVLSAILKKDLKNKLGLVEDLNGVARVLIYNAMKQWSVGV